MNSKAERVTAILALLLLMLNLVPPLLKENEKYFDNAYFTILYLLLSYVAIVVPLFVKTWPFIRVVCFVVGGWFISALVFEFINWFEPEKVFNDKEDNTIYPQVIVAFIISLSIYIIYRWRTQKHYNT